MPVTRATAQRQGSTMIVVCILLAIMMVAVAFSVDVARIQLTRLELQSTADVASRAGAEALARGVGDPNSLPITDSALREEILMVGELNYAGGGLVDLNASTDIAFGQATDNDSGKFTFVENGGGSFDASTNSVRVLPSLDNYPISFGAFVGHTELALTNLAAAMVEERDIVVVLDRSTSMMYHDAGTIPVVDYNANLLQLEDDMYEIGDLLHPGTSGTHATSGPPAWNTEFEYVASDVNLSRLQALKLAVFQFRKEIDSTRGHEQLGLATYSSVGNSPGEGQTPLGGSYDIESGLSPAQLTQIIGGGMSLADIVAPFQQHPSQKYASALELESTGYPAFDLNYLAMRWAPLTNIVDGLNKGVQILFGPGRRPSATPILILMTDGNHNQGGSPTATATAAMSSHPNMRIFTVTFGAGADQATMQQIANTGKGEHHHANDVTDLIAIFEDLARTAGVTLIE